MAVSFFRPYRLIDRFIFGVIEESVSHGTMETDSFYHSVTDLCDLMRCENLYIEMLGLTDAFLPA